MYNPFDFSGKRYIVTGGTSGIGYCVAKQLSNQGARLFLIGRNENKLNNVISELEGDGHRYFVTDLSKENDYTGVFDEIVSDGTKPDGFVYCAAIADVEPLNSITESRFYDSMKTNLFSFVEMIKVYSKKKYHNIGSSIVGISSTSALYPEKCNSMYVATKASMNAVVKSLARELCQKDIRINTVMPAFVDTRMLRTADDECRQMGIEVIHNRQLLGVSHPEDVANVIMFLLSDSSSVITGREIFADGGDLNF